jgi:hypothetical protein
MVIELLDIGIKLFTIGGSILGIIAFYLTYKEFKRKKPIIQSYTEISSYKSIETKKGFQLLFKLNFVVNNNGSIGTSITGCEGLLRYHKNVRKFTEGGGIDSQPNEDNIFPIDIPPDGSKKFTLTFNFDNKYGTQFYDRCMVPLDLNNPKKWEWNDLPIVANFTFRHTKGTFDTTACVFRADLPESKRKLYLSSSEKYDSKIGFYPDYFKEDSE